MIDVWKIRSAKWAEKEQNLATIYKHRSSARSLTHSANCIEVLWINSLRNFTTNTQTHTRIQCNIQFRAHFIHWHYSLSLYVTRVLCGTVIFQVSSKIQPNKSDGNQRKLHGKEIKANKIITLHTMNFLMNSFSHVHNARLELTYLWILFCRFSEPICRFFVWVFWSNRSIRKRRLRLLDKKRKEMEVDRGGGSHQSRRKPSHAERKSATKWTARARDEHKTELKNSWRSVNW